MRGWGSVGSVGGKISSPSSHTSHPSHTFCLPHPQKSLQDIAAAIALVLSIFAININKYKQKSTLLMD